MKRIVMTLAALVFSTALALAQSPIKFRIGPKIGAGISTVVADNVRDAISQDTEFSAGDAQVSFQIGAFSRLELGTKKTSFFIQPEMYFSSIGAQTTFRDITNSNSLGGANEQIFTDNINRLDIPVLVGIKSGVMRFGAGPVGSFIINKGTSWADDTQAGSLGLQAGIGVDIWRLSFDLRYEGAITRFAKEAEVYGRTFTSDQRMRQFLFSVGYSFL